MRLFLAVLTLLALSAVTGGPMMGEFAAQAGEHSEGFRRLIESVQREKALAGARDAKLGSALSSVLDRIETRGITRANARAMNAQALSNALVRLDTDANIQVYIHLTDSAPPALAQLRRREAARDEIILGGSYLSCPIGCHGRSDDGRVCRAGRRTQRGPSESD